MVKVYDSENYNKDARILHEQKFMPRPTDPSGYQLGNALRRAEQHAQHMEKTFPDKYVEVDPIWG